MHPKTREIINNAVKQMPWLTPEKAREDINADIDDQLKSGVSHKNIVKSLVQAGCKKQLALQFLSERLRVLPKELKSEKLLTNEEKKKKMLLDTAVYASNIVKSTPRGNAVVANVINFINRNNPEGCANYLKSMGFTKKQAVKLQLMCVDAFMIDAV